MASRADPSRTGGRSATRALDPALVAFVEALARANAARDVRTAHQRITGAAEDVPT